MDKETDTRKFKKKPLKDGIIKVIGVGGGGIHAVSHIYREGIGGLAFATCDTCNDTLNNSPVPVHLLMERDSQVKDNNAECVRLGAEKNEPELRFMLNNGTKMSLIIACMGGDTGTNAAPVIARISKELGILTVGIVTMPFHFEDQSRIGQALEGIEEMARNVDSLMVINNEHLRAIHPETSSEEAFAKTDEALCTTVRNLMEFITVDGLVNILFDDLKKMLKGGGVVFIGTGIGKREHAFRKAIKNALRSPFFNGTDVNNSKKVLLNIVIANKEGVCYVTEEDFDDVYEFMKRLKAGDDIDFIWGLDAVKKRAKSVKATVLATGFELKDVDPLMANHLKRHEGHPLDVEQVDALVEKLRSHAAQDKQIFPWEDVFASIKKYPEKVCLSSRTCPDCGERLVQLYFSSPDRTWQQLCGRAGDMLVCPNCHAQKDFILRILN